jgi:hypothetical protein
VQNGTPARSVEASTWLTRFWMKVEYSNAEKRKTSWSHDDLDQWEASIGGDDQWDQSCKHYPRFRQTGSYITSCYLTGGREAHHHRKYRHFVLRIRRYAGKGSPKSWFIINSAYKFRLNTFKYTLMPSCKICSTLPKNWILRPNCCTEIEM